MDVEVVPSHFSESSSCKDAVQRCVLCCRMTLFFSRHVMKCTITLQKCLKVTSSIRGFPLCQKLYQYASFSIPKDGSHGLSVWGQCFHILFLGRCCAMLFHTLLFCFWIKVMEIAFLACYDAAKKVVVFNSILFQQLQWNKLSGIPNFLPSHEAHSVPFQHLLLFPCHVLLISNELINFSFFSLGVKTALGWA